MVTFTFRRRVHFTEAGFCLATLGGLLSCASLRPATTPPAIVATTPPPAPAGPASAVAPAPPADPNPSAASPSPGTPAVSSASEPPAPTPPVFTLTAAEGLTILARERAVSSHTTVRVPAPTMGPDFPIPPEVVTRIFRRSRAALRDCYLRALVAAPALTGVVRSEFVVDAEGAVRGVAVTKGLTPELDACVVGQIRQAMFPQPRGGQVTVRYAFSFLLG